MKRFIKSLMIFSCLYGMSSYNQAKAAEIITVRHNGYLGTEVGRRVYE